MQEIIRELKQALENLVNEWKSERLEWHENRQDVSLMKVPQPPTGGALFEAAERALNLVSLPSAGRVTLEGPDIAPTETCVVCNEVNTPFRLDGKPTCSGCLGKNKSAGPTEAESLPDSPGESVSATSGIDQAPVHPIEIRISIGAEDWHYVISRLKDYLWDVERNEVLRNQMTGGAGGSSSVTVALRDVSKEQFRKELDEWFERQAKPGSFVDRNLKSSVSKEATK